MATFIVDCPRCRAKVAAVEAGRAQRNYTDEDNAPYSERLSVGQCPVCTVLLAGFSTQTHFADIDAEYDVWSDPVRVYPNPAKTFSSFRIPRVVTGSLTEAIGCLQGNAVTAACVMLGRALEGVCRDVLLTPEEKKDARRNRRMMLRNGIQQLRDKGVIDNRLFDWSQQLNAFRNLAAHPEGDSDEPITREDAEDLQAFVHAIIEYVYDLAERFEEFKEGA